MKHLFIDPGDTQYLDGVRRVFHQPVKDRGPVLVPERPWEGERVHLWNPPCWNPQRQCWQLWYIGGEDLLPLYAESADGKHWEKPSLGLVEWGGTRNNNIVSLGFEASFKERRLVLLRDVHEADPELRYKALTRVGGQLLGLGSADGLQWRRISGACIPSNDEYRLGFDGLRQRYVATVKGSPVPEFGRAVCLSWSENFREWTEPELVFWGDEIDQHVGRERLEAACADPDRRHPLIDEPAQYHTDIYNMPVFTYAERYLALPVLFHHSGAFWYHHEDDASPRLRSNQDGILQPELAWSRDLRTWQRGERVPFLPLSRLSDAANFDHGAIHALAPVAVGDELWFFYYGSRFTHLRRSVIEASGARISAAEPLGAIYRARLRLDGFASLQGGDHAGVALTCPVQVTGTHLYVNADARGGDLRVELRDALDGRVIPGYGMGDTLGTRWIYAPDRQSRQPCCGRGARFADDPVADDTVPIDSDSSAIPVRWRTRGDVAELRGRMVRLCFRLRHAEIFSFSFADTHGGGSSG